MQLTLACRTMLRLVQLRAEAVVALSRTEERFLSGRVSGRRVVVILNGADFAVATSEPQLVITMISARPCSEQSHSNSAWSTSPPCPDDGGHSIGRTSPRGATAAVLPVVTEPAPSVLKEALTCLRPLVASAAGGIPQSPGRAGLLMARRDPDALASPSGWLTLHSTDLAGGTTGGARCPVHRDASARRHLALYGAVSAA